MDLEADEFIKTLDQKTHHKEMLRNDRGVYVNVQRVILSLRQNFSTYVSLDYLHLKLRILFSI